jgi:pSer/pThr/pTyr-binding forkhead associated (FHA) protein
LLKDLHTPGGTLCNNNRIDLVSLADGDVLTVGQTRIQVAIQVPPSRNDDSGCGLEWTEPTKFSKPYRLALEHTDQSWTIQEAVIVAGRDKHVSVHLDHEAVSARHAIFFRFAGGLAISDVGSRSGISVNGSSCLMGKLSDGDRIGFGPLILSVDSCPQPPPGTDPQRADPGETPAGTPLISGGPDPTSALAKIEADLTTLEGHITSSWARLNSLESQNLAEEAKRSRRQSDLAAREAALDARDAMLRGQMHDLARFHEQLTARERELAAQVAQIQIMRDDWTAAEHALAQRKAEFEKQLEDLRRREHVFAQRWARLSTLTCPHCGSPLHLAHLTSPDSPG